MTSAPVEDEPAAESSSIDSPRPTGTATSGAPWSRRQVDFVLLGVCVLALAVPGIAAAGLSVPGRPALALLFLLCVPGAGLALALKLASPLLTLALALSLSLAVTVLYGTLSIVADSWHPVAGSWAIAALGIAGAALAFARHRSSGGPVTADETSLEWFAQLDDGRELPVHETVVVGRRLSDDGDNDPRTVSVPDRMRSVSKRHFTLGIDAEGVVVVDLGSTNGLTVTTPDGVSERCGRGEPVPVPAGSVVSFGQHWLTVHQRRTTSEPGSGPEPTPSPPAASTVRDPTARSARADRTRTLSLVVLAAAVLLWWLETLRVPLDRAGVLGLLPVLSWRYLLALILLSVVVIYSLLRPRLDHLVLTVCALLVALVGYATVSVADREGSVPVAWVHVGFVQYISQNGTVPASVDARFSWPGFFAAGAQLVALAGTQDSRNFLVLAPVVYLALALPALLLIAHFVTRSWRWAWVAVFIFLFTNWYQQDYFAPQATAFVIYVTIVATLLFTIDGARVPELHGNLWRRCREGAMRLPGLPPGVGTGTAQVIGLVLATLVVGLVAVHQLTPVNLVFSLLAFTITGLTRYRLLWLLTAVAIAGWFSYGATDFWVGHLDNVVGDVGQVGASLDSSVTGRLVGDPTYQRAQFVRIGWSAALFAAAALGAWFLRRRREVLLLVGLACAPFGLVLVQSYGGEVFIRCFLYASPLLAPMTAVAIRTVGRLVRRRAGFRRLSLTGAPSPSLRWVAALLPLVVVAGLVMTFTRGLNVSFERSPRAQVQAAGVLYDMAKPGDVLGLPLGVGLTPYYLEGTRFPVKKLELLSCDGTTVMRCLDGTPPRFVLFSITQERTGELLQSRPVGWLWQISDRLVTSGQYERVYAAEDAQLLRLVEGQGP